MKNAIVIGGGFTGFIWAHLLAQKKWAVTIIEKSPFVGGGIRTLWHNGHPYTLGPRHLYTDNKVVFDFLNSIVPLRRLNHYIKSYIAQDDNFYSFPPHVDDIEKMPDAGKIRDELNKITRNETPPKNLEEKWIQTVGATIYKKFVDKYTCKAWQIPSATLIDSFGYDRKGIALRTGSHQLLPDGYVAYPISIQGWDDLFATIAAHPNISLRTNTEVSNFDLEKKRIRIGQETLSADLIVNTISLDTLCDYTYGALPYMGRTMQFLILPGPFVFPDNLFFLHYSGDEPYTRVVEYKKLTGYVSQNTLLGFEYPQPNLQHYPYPFKAEIERANRYLKSLPEGVISVGRLGRYTYLDMAPIVEDALNNISNY